MRLKVNGQKQFFMQGRYWVREIPLAHTVEGKKFLNPNTVVRIKPGKKVQTQWLEW